MSNTDTWQPPTPLEQLAMNPHQLEYGRRVILPDGRLGTVSKTGWKYAHVDADNGADWKGELLQLRPYSEVEAGRPRVEQLALF